MHKRMKITHLLFIWLTGPMFFAHGITHHHHFDSVFEHSQQCGHDDGHSENNPAHCHAFNDLIVDKTTVSFSILSFPDHYSTPGLSTDLHFQPTETPSGHCRGNTAKIEECDPKSLIIQG